MKKFLTLIFLVIIGSWGATAQELDHVQGDVLLQIAPGSDIYELERDLAWFNGQPTDIKVVYAASEPFRIWLLHFDYTTIDERAFLRYLWLQEAVEVAQFNHLITERQTVPDDTNFSQQWHWLNDGSNGAVADADVDADLVWDLSTGGNTFTGNHEIVVCVVEGGGANYNHEDLIDNHWTNAGETPDDGMDNDDNGYVDDYNGWNPVAGNDNIPSGGHGTQVSGMIGAVGNNMQGVTGMNWDVKIMQVTFGGTQEAAVIAAYTYPYIMRKEYNESGGDRGAFVVATNSSWGIDGGDPDDAPLWCAFYDTLGTVGILSCGATTNSNLDVDAVGDLPTACPSDYMVSVARTGSADNHAGGYGLTQVDFGAPGISVYTTSGNGGYSSTTGTSFASPLTAGVIALMYASPCPSVGLQAFSDPGGTALMVKNAIMDGTDPVPSMDGISVTGGRINAFNAMQIIMGSCGPCPPPGPVQVSEVIDTSVLVSWNSSDSTLMTNLRYRELGDTIWIDSAGVSSPVALSGLMACTDYEIQLEDMCSDTTSGYTESVIFQTDGCCVAPMEVTVSDIGTDSALVNWTSVLAANSYNVEVYILDAVLLYENVDTNFFELADLPECELIGVAVQTVCDTGLTNFTPLLEFQTFGCGPCTDQTYCENVGNTVDEFIESIQIGSFENISGTDEGYGDYTGGMSLEVSTYGVYDVMLAPGYNGFNYDEVFKIWIDFDQDGAFNEGDELVFQSPDASNQPVSGQITIPPGVLTGLTRMRVGMQWGGFGGGAEPVPCPDGDYFGEAEDYCIEIMEGMPPQCLVPENLAVGNVGFTAALLTWDVADNALEYNIQYRPVGAMDWMTIGSTTNEVTISELEPCTDYEFQVETVCVGGTSGYSTSFVFQSGGCCEPPAEVWVTDIGSNSALVNWSGVVEANGYNLELYILDAVILYENIDTNFFELTDLPVCDLIGVTVQTVCDTGLTDFTPLLEFQTAGCGACTDLTYCDNVGNAVDEFIESIQIGSFENISGTDEGYGDYTGGMAVEVSTFGIYDVTLVPGYNDIIYDEVFKIWIDFDQDGIFNETDELVFQSPEASDQPVNGQIIIPPGVPTGLTRMRVGMQWGGSSGGDEPIPCPVEDYFGEAEDYCIEITEGMPPLCLVPENLDTIEVLENSAVVTWDGTANATSYSVRYKEVALMDWTELVTADLQQELTDLDDCTDYEFQVKALCDFDLESGYSASMMFETACFSSTRELPEGVSGVQVYPNPFSDQLVLSFELERAQDIRLELIDVVGRVHFQSLQNWSSGTHSWGLELGNELPAGIYYLKLDNGAGQVVEKLVRF